MSTWSEYREEFANLKSEEPSFYKSKIRELVLAGFKLADAEMEQLYGELVGDRDDDDFISWYLENRKSTYPQIRKTKPHHGIYMYGTHDRSESVEDAIVEMGRLHKGTEAWVMPVFDDQEYVSFEFDVIVGSREDVLKTLRNAIKAGLNKAPN